MLDKSIRTQFASYFPNPDTLKKRRSTGKKSAEAKEKEPENPYKLITRWFDAGNHIDLMLDMKDAAKVEELYKVDGLFGLVKKHYPVANENEHALLMEFVLHGLASYSLISKKTLDGKIIFKDLMASMMNLGSITSEEEDDFNETDYR